MRIAYTIVESSLGRLLVAATERGVSAVSLGTLMLISKLPCERSTRTPRFSETGDREAV